MFTLLKSAVSARIGLQDAVQDWSRISLELREAPRRRRTQVAMLFDHDEAGLVS